MQLIVDHLSLQYNKGLSTEVKALDDVNLVINEGDFIGLLGHTGSGKSTLVQLLTALLEPTSGTIYFEGEDVFDKSYDRRKLRSKVGLVFQYPEHQLFEENVFEDVCFGPRNLGLDRKSVELRAYEALKKVGMPDELFYQSPFDMSGGQKRKAAIAGVLAMKPEILILDEPTAGLDPQGRDEILGLLRKMHDEDGITIILVSHSMEDVANYVNRIVVLDSGKLLYDDKPRAVFANYKKLEEIGLSAPKVTYVMDALRASGIEVPEDIITIDEAAQAIIKALS
ncbi:MAG: energy-coupling factor transporter ATPase [Lachnospiraceae bacterium]|nr:energy-coupling factor transporter ATPase [Lachnospiraceae bacterium]